MDVSFSLLIIYYTLTGTLKMNTVLANLVLPAVVVQVVTKCKPSVLKNEAVMEVSKLQAVNMFTAWYKEKFWSLYFFVHDNCMGDYVIKV